MNELEKKVVEHDEQIKSLFANQKKLEKVIDKINDLTVSIGKMTLIQQGLIDEQKDMRSDLDKIKEQPAKDAHEIKMKVILSIITTVAGAIVGALLALIIKGGI